MNTDQKQLTVPLSMLIGAPSVARGIVPAPRVPVSVRPATLDDLPFIDGLQKKHSKQLGFMKTKALEGKVKLGHVLIAVGARLASPAGDTSVAPTGERLGYVIGNDQYFKRDDVGVIYQLNVEPGKQRSLIGATLVKAMFDRAAYGCRLFCCWCAQDIAANHFWESLGFVPLAFRTGSRDKGRIHIFWQKRIREGDTTTPWWFPSKTTGGMIGEDRLVFPIPPGTHWSEAKPVILPGEDTKQLEAPRARQSRTSRSRAHNPKKVHKLGRGHLFFVTPKPAKADKPPKPPRQKQKHDPQHVAAARELRDRYLEQVNSGQFVLESAGKYDVSRALPAPASSAQDAPVAILPNAQPRQLPLPLPTAA